MPEQLFKDQSFKPTSVDSGAIEPVTPTELGTPALDLDPLQPSRIRGHRRGAAATFIVIAALGALGKAANAPALAASENGFPKTGHVGHEHDDVVSPQASGDQIKTYSSRISINS